MHISSVCRGVLQTPVLECNCLIDGNFAITDATTLLHSLEATLCFVFADDKDLVGQGTSTTFTCTSSCSTSSALLSLLQEIARVTQSGYSARLRQQKRKTKGYLLNSRHSLTPRKVQTGRQRRRRTLRWQRQHLHLTKRRVAQRGAHMHYLCRQLLFHAFVRAVDGLVLVERLQNACAVSALCCSLRVEHSQHQQLSLFNLALIF